MHPDTLFSADFAAARAKFLAACTLRGLAPQTHLHPLAGAHGEMLATDVVRIGPDDAARLLVLTSGVHGVELFAGAGCQIDWLLTHPADALPRDTAVVLVHAINPWGASWLRRYTEDNVDLCRNSSTIRCCRPRRPTRRCMRPSTSIPAMPTPLRAAMRCWPTSHAHAATTRSTTR